MYDQVIKGPRIIVVMSIFRNVRTTGSLTPELAVLKLHLTVVVNHARLTGSPKRGDSVAHLTLNPEAKIFMESL